MSFGDEAVTDAGLHRRRVAGALGKPGEITLVAAAEAAPGRPVGWAWLSARTNSLTGARYGNFRSLAVADVPDRSQIGELLLAAVLRAADEAGHAPADRQGARAGTSACGRCTGSSASRRRTSRWSGRTKTGGPGANGPAGGHGTLAMMVKCVIWDLDNTLLSGVYLESGPQPPPPDPAMVAVAASCATGASSTRSPAGTRRRRPQYAAQVTGLEFAAAECGWGRKSDAVRRIIADLGLAPDAVAFVDDDLYERAEVSFAVPRGAGAVAGGHGRRRRLAGVQPPGGHGRGPPPRRDVRRAAAPAGGGPGVRRVQGRVPALLRHPGDDRPGDRGRRAAAARAVGAHASVQHRPARPWPRPELAALAGSAEHQVTTVRLADRFGDDGLVGGCVDRDRPRTAPGR